MVDDKISTISRSSHPSIFLPSDFANIRMSDVSLDAPLPDDLDDLRFEEALDRLEAIVEQLDEDPPDLDTALDAYEDGVTLAQHCLDRLNDAEERLEELSLD